ncbi:hypothetical protein [Brevundimonas sp. SORGH_AS_0993]|uniref:hypothetical protein n=1 Tax=Brevundimonas sp. SORGH_AS_0993 TaxID=3041794 RepID=UPI0027804335|nr:hypothetical protein [Brevundimonas sp. SORGH_AS_0993]MDQ1155486.1 hypothetical protein [Brevundimonas sp. SORGH_AS_0993]
MSQKTGDDEFGGFNPGQSFKVTRATPEDIARFHENRAAVFPTARYGAIRQLTEEKVDAFEAALEAGPEEGIQQALTDCPYLLQYATPNSGHHGLWAFPKETIRPRSALDDPGLIPDFLIVTASSLGYFWHIVELKRFDADFGNAAGDGFSTTAHKAIAQCNGYLEHLQDYIDTVRASLRLKKLIQPTGAVLLIGDSDRETPRQVDVRRAFVRNTPRIDVVTYRRLLHGARADLMFHASAAAWQEIG